MWRGLAGTLGVWVAGAAVLRVALVQPEVCPPLTAADAVTAAREAAAWMARNQRPDGTFLYEFDIDAGAQIPGYNVVRHAGVMMSLYQLAGVEPESGALGTADRGLRWARQQLFEHGDWTALRDPDDGSIESGGSALLLAALAQRRLATGDASQDELMRRVGRFLLVMEQPDGSFLLAWDRERGAPNPYERSKYATGEAFWALALMHRIFPEEGWDVPARRVADYLSLHRDRVEQQKFPPWADQWAAYGLAEMAAWPGPGPQLSGANAAYARRLSERFGFLVRVDSRRTESTFDRLIHGRRARAAGAGTWSEALDSLWRLAGRDERLADLRPKLAQRAVCIAGMLRDRQYSPREAARTTAPPVAEGAWFTDGVTRMDDQQHALSGILRAAEVMQAGGGR